MQSRLQPLYVGLNPHRHCSIPELTKVFSSRLQSVQRSADSGQKQRFR